MKDRRHVHLLRARRGFTWPNGERGYSKAVNIRAWTTGTIARVRAGLQAVNAGIPQGYPDYVLPWCVVRNSEEGQDLKRAGSYVTCAT
jgi:arginyl-tRNA synthetase